jgi:hypothetical protein
MRFSIRAVAGIALALAMFGGATPVPRADAADGWSGSYSVFTPRSFSMQHLDYTCVGASVQMMLNMIHGRADHSVKRQNAYWRYGNEHDKYAGGKGVDPVGWLSALENFGAGDYSINVESNYATALRQLASAMRATGKPIGLFVHRGGHAWVMTGFASTADPADGGSFDVTSVQVMGPLYPYGTLGGGSYDPGPRTWLSAAQLRTKFSPMVSRGAEWRGRFVAMIPV